MARPTDLTGHALAGIRALPGLPRLPGVPDVLRRIEVPKDLEPITTHGPEDDPREAGLSRRAVERMWDAAQDLFRSGVHPAIQVTVRRHGITVLDRAIGHAREGVLATPQTPFVIYSASKAITALVVHMLDERGALHIGDPVAEYIDGYERHGKEHITIASVLAHRAGVPNINREALHVESAHDLDRIAEILIDAKPLSRPGKLLAYHAVSGGFILGEVVRQATGKTIKDVLDEEILRPLGFRWGSYGVAKEDLGEVALNYATGAPLMPPLSTQLNRVLGAPVGEVTEIANDPRFLQAVVPAANIVTSANELSRFFEIARAGGTMDGHHVWEPRTLRRALVEQSYLEVDRSLGFPTRFSYGLMLGAKRLSLYGPDTQGAFGHLGFTNILGWADRERATSVAIVTNGKPVLYPEIAKWWGFGWRVGHEAGKIDPAQDPLARQSSPHKTSA